MIARATKANMPPTPTGALTLFGGEVAVRWAQPTARESAAAAVQAEAVLGIEEREAFGRIRPAAARRDYLAAHLLARTTLAEIVGCHPGRLRFCSSPRGRPELVAPPGASRVSFSIAHADGVALCAAAVGHVVGADVESLRNLGSDLPGVAEVVCSRQENEMLRPLPPSARAERLLSIWTLKEAFAKATGQGFHIPLTRFTIHWKNGEPKTIEFDREMAEDVSVWRFVLLSLTSCHRVAIAESRTRILEDPGRVVGADALVRRDSAPYET